ncbi:class I adenylate-forming enzyme family protein [Terrabacter aerolatus]|uniref:Fatty-acyl-CoA synthase n=1 Tax=Terrabacter aerolatus TaxID=422442 RepID=A0A512CXK9_9MICO|nr:class I adenylate-forming enzyme family protein [Terrabacter aerolatus]GEO28962.1 fatty-acyl-CoA synthase [Terrabacter aerolatus]
MTPTDDLVTAILARAADEPRRVAIRDHRRRSVSFGELAARIDGVAAHLTSHGLGAGDGVLLAVRPSPRAVAAALGVVRAGGVVVVADPGAGEALLDVRRRTVPVRAAVADTVVHSATRKPLSSILARLPATAGLRLPDLSTPGLVHVVTGPRLPGVPRGATRWEHLPQVVPQSVAADPAADALVVFTSGSTAAPRAVVHTLGSLSAGVRAAVAALELDERVVMHTDQLMIGLPTLAAGGVWSLPPVTASTRAWLRQAAAEQATHAYAVPAKLLAAATHGLPPSVRHLATGGAPVLPVTVRRLGSLAPTVEVRAVYGLTEALPVAVATGEEVLASPPGRTCLGHPVPGVTVCIEPHGPDGVGEIVVHGPQARHRLAGEQAGAEVHTGDLGELDGDGRLLLAGRAKNMIIRGQANIYPELVEPLLLDSLRDVVTDGALVGLPDSVTGDERVVLALVPTDASRRTGEAALSRRVHRVWQSLADEAWRPDDVVAVEAVPRRGRSAAVDLDALRSVLSCRLPTVSG